MAEIKSKDNTTVKFRKCSSLIFTFVLCAVKRSLLTCISSNRDNGASNRIDCSVCALCIRCLALSLSLPFDQNRHLSFSSMHPIQILSKL